VAMQRDEVLRLWPGPEHLSRRSGSRAIDLQHSVGVAQSGADESDSLGLTGALDLEPPREPESTRDRDGLGRPIAGGL
jgi:hypothetical protein